MPVRTSLFLSGLLSLLLLTGPASHAQISRQKQLETLRARSELWNRAFNSRDTTALAALLDAQVAISAANGTQLGATENGKAFSRLMRQRPDINWLNKPTQLDLNEQWQLACETGEWTESWTEPRTAEKTRIVGKYCLLWKNLNGTWVIASAIFTPLSCVGSYCKN